MKDRIKEEISNIEQPHFCEKEKERNLLYPVIPWGEGGNSQGTQQPYNNFKKCLERAYARSDPVVRLHKRLDNSCGHTILFYLRKTDLPRVNSLKPSRGKFISDFVLPR